MNASEKDLDLIRDYLAGESNAETARILGERLKNDTTLRAEFLAHARVDTALSVLCAFTRGPGGPTVKGDPAYSGPLRRVHPNHVAALSLAACAASLLCVLSLWWSARPQQQPPLVTLVTSTQARWADPNIDLALRAGDFPKGLLRLEEGKVELTTQDGARVFLQAPVAVRFDSRKRIFCESGRLVCECPTPASRLEVQTPQTLVIDLGTIFSVDATPDSTTKVAVISGEVELRGSGARRLRKGEMAVVRSDVVRIDLLPESHSTLLRALLSETHDTSPKLANLLSENWLLTSEHVAWDMHSRSVHIQAGDLRQYPMAHQIVHTGNIAFRTVVASVCAESNPENPLHERQYAVLKVAFLDSAGREFACAFRHFLKTRGAAPRREKTLLAAVAPPGTEAVQIQVLLNTDKRDTGSARFDAAFLGIE